MRKLTTLAALLAAVLALGAAPAGAVLYGQPDGDSHPYVGLAVFGFEDGVPRWRCSGTLLSPTVFLTAGHCTDGAAFAQVWFDSTRPGGYPVSGGTMGVPVTHPQYDGFASFPNTRDVGVVLLSQPVEMDTYGELPEAGRSDALQAARRDAANASFTIVGYGLQGVRPQLLTAVDRHSGETMLVTTTSDLTAGFNIQVTSSPGKHSGGVCFGDSGGPMLYGTSNVVAAINSFVLNGNCVGAGFGYRADIADTLGFVTSFLR